ncbi:MAG TPA: hypothetical protein VGG92_09375 [Caulobacteraceae bacterium]
MNERPSRTQMRARLLPSAGGGYDFPSAGGGYDFHRSLRLRAHRYLMVGEPMEDVMASIAQIVRAPEQASARLGLERLEQWRTGHLGEIVPYAPITYESPAGLFKVTFTADFGIRLGRDGIAAHLWNTATPALSPRMVYAALSLFEPLYAAADNPPDDIAVLSLREPRLYRLSEAGRFAGLGASLANRIEEMMRDITDELDLPGHEDRPGQIR